MKNYPNTLKKKQFNTRATKLNEQQLHKKCQSAFLEQRETLRRLNVKERDIASFLFTNKRSWRVMFWIIVINKRRMWGTSR